jgi:hypothetical protein
MSDRLLTWPQLATMVPYTRQHVARLEGEDKSRRASSAGQTGLHGGSLKSSRGWTISPAGP